MKKAIISSFIVLFLVSILGYFIYDAKIQREHFSFINKKVKSVMLINAQLDLYTLNNLTYDNFDIIQNKIDKFKNEIETIKHSPILFSMKDPLLKSNFAIVKNVVEKKIDMLGKIKAYRAILNNSFRIVQKIKKLTISNNLDQLYTIIMTIDKNPELNIQDELKKISNITTYANEYEKYFLKHSKKILEYQMKFIDTAKSLEQLQTNQKLEEFSMLYEQYSQSKIQKAHLSVVGLLVLLAVLIALYLLYSYKIIILNKSLFRFKNAVENSDNIVVVTDENEKIKYINDAFTKTTGYTLQEVIGLTPSILKSGQQSQEFYKDLKSTIYSGKKWSGELSYEKASITPILDDDGNIIEFISIKLDVTDETLAKEQLKQKENLLIQQSKMAAMGEMLENIAHQWRQPLSVVSTLSTGMKFQKEYAQLTDKMFYENMDKINDTIQHLSQTIDDFRDFFKPNKEKKLFNLKDIYAKTLHLINTKLKNLSIELVENLNDVQVKSLDTEMIQVLMNILNNAKDALETKDIKNRLIFVNIYHDENNAIIEIKDNAGGVKENIIDKIFEPYFTTKHQSQGTGIGLYMSQEIVTKHMGGTLLVQNTTFKYNDENYTGAQFTITLPLS